VGRTGFSKGTKKAVAEATNVIWDGRIILTHRHQTSGAVISSTCWVSNQPALGIAGSSFFIVTVDIIFTSQHCEITCDFVDPALEFLAELFEVNIIHR
jgi:hypothetical protein